MTVHSLLLIVRNGARFRQIKIWLENVRTLLQNHGGVLFVRLKGDENLTFTLVDHLSVRLVGWHCIHVWIG